jgi:hypothetical protein
MMKYEVILNSKYKLRYIYFNLHEVFLVRSEDRKSKLFKVFRSKQIKGITQDSPNLLISHMPEGEER